MKKGLLVLFTLTFSFSAFAVYDGVEMSPSRKMSFTTVQIISPDGGGCTGVFVDRGVILTASHCKPLVNGEMGLQFFEGSQQGTLAWIAQKDFRFVAHPNATKEKKGSLKHFDLALILIRESALPQAYDVAKIATEEELSSLKTGSIVYTLGAGTNGYKTHKGLLYLAVGRVLEKIAPSSLILEFRASLICSGDSGGPSFLNPEEDFRLFAITVEVKPVNKKIFCGNPVETIHLTQAHRNWISSTVAKGVFR